MNLLPWPVDHIPGMAVFPRVTTEKNNRAGMKNSFCIKVVETEKFIDKYTPDNQLIYTCSWVDAGAIRQTREMLSKK